MIAADPGRTAYEARFADARPREFDPWDSLAPEVKAIWARVEAACARVAETRGAQAMRLVCADMVSGLRIVETPRRAEWDAENAGIRSAERTILGAPLPRAYHGSARDAVLAVLHGDKGLKERGGGSAA